MAGWGATRVSEVVTHGHVPAPRTGEPSTPEPSVNRGRVFVIVFATALIAHAVWRIWLASPLFTPVVLGDESRYLIFARVLAGGPGGVGGDTEATRRVGYALLVSPSYWLTSDPFLVHRFVQGINGLINLMTLPLAYLFARRVLGASQWWALGAAFVAAALPAVTFFSAFALPNAVLTPFLLAWLLTLHRWITAENSRARLWAAGGSGLIIGYMYVIHVRALLLLAVHALIVVGLLVAKRLRLAEAGLTAAAIAAMLLLHTLLKSLLIGKVITGGTEPENRMLSAFTTVDGILRTVSDGAGQIWYIAVSTWGLGAIGLVLTGYHLARRRGYAWPAQVILAGCLVSTLLIAVVTAAALPDDGKVNNHIYPGYIIFLAPVWVLVALTALRDAPWRKVAAAAAGAAGLLLVTWFVVESYTRPMGAIGSPAIFSPIDAPEPLFLGGNWSMVRLAYVTAVTLGAIAVMAGLILVRRPLALSGLVLLAATAVSVAAMSEANSSLTAYAVAQTGPQLVRDAGVRPGEVVACDGSVIARYNHQREVYWGPLMMLDLKQSAPPRNVTIMVARWHTGVPGVDWDGTAHGYLWVVGDPLNQWAVWRKDSAAS